MGVFPTVELNISSPISRPHARGGVSQDEDKREAMMRSSPRPWGCFYVTQMQWQMECTGRQWCDFVSFDPRLPEQYEIWIKRVDRDDAMIETLKTEIQLFETELATLMEQLQ